MPIYEFQCDKCKKQFEVLTMSMREKPNAVCPKCKSKKTRKLISKVGKGKYSSVGKGGSADTGVSSGASGCASCSSTNCSSCGH